MRLSIPQATDGLKLTLHWHSLAWPGKPDPDTQVRVLLDGREVGTLTAHPGWEDASLDLPASPAGGIAVIELVSSIGNPPGQDNRQLGVAVDKIGLVSKNQ